MEYQKIKSPKTKKLIYIHGSAYNKLISQKLYTEEYLLSLPRTTAVKPLSPNYTKVAKKSPPVNKIILPDDMIYEVALQLPYFGVINLCNTNQKYNAALCQNEQFWQLKYKKDFTEFDKQEYEKELAYWTQWFPSDILSYDEYINNKFIGASNKWEILYSNTFYATMANITNIIFKRFDVWAKYDNDYDDRKHKIATALIKFVEKGQVNKISTVVTKIKKLLETHYKDFNDWYRFFGKNPPDNDTAEEFLAKMVLKALEV